jgi:hypothetical protein
MAEAKALKTKEVEGAVKFLLEVFNIIGVLVWTMIDILSLWISKSYCK